MEAHEGDEVPRKPMKSRESTACGLHDSAMNAQKQGVPRVVSSSKYHRHRHHHHPIHAFNSLNPYKYELSTGTPLPLLLVKRSAQPADEILVYHSFVSSSVGSIRIA